MSNCAAGRKDASRNSTRTYFFCASNIRDPYLPEGADTRPAADGHNRNGMGPGYLPREERCASNSGKRVGTFERRYQNAWKYGDSMPILPTHDLATFSLWEKEFHHRAQSTIPKSMASYANLSLN